MSIFRRLVTHTGSMVREEFQGRTHLLDPRFTSNPNGFFFQAMLATAGMLIILLFVDSVSNAAVAAGLGSSVVIIFINPSNQTANLRAVVGGHTLALVIGTAFAFLLFAGPVETFLDGATQVRTLSLAVSVGVLILFMAVTDTEHPPSAGIVIGMSGREWEPEIFGAISGAVALLAVIKIVLRPHLNDLI